MTARASKAGSQMPPSPADHRGLGSVAHPAWLRHGDIRPDGQEQAEQQRLAAWPRDHRVRGRRQGPAGPVARGGLAQGGQPGHRAVGVAAGGGGQRVAQEGVGGQPGLAEGEWQDRLARLPLAGHDLVRSQGGRDRDRAMHGAGNGRASAGRAGAARGTGQGGPGARGAGARGPRIRDRPEIGGGKRGGDARRAGRGRWIGVIRRGGESGGQALGHGCTSHGHVTDS
jgi:hypothetical protein